MKPNGRACIVGDDRQNCYTFRGAMHDGLDSFKEKLSAKELTLTTSYRCPRRAIGMAQLIVPDIKAWDNAIEGEILNMNHDKMLNEIKVKSVVLSRINSQLVKTCLALLRKGKPAYCEGRDLSKTLLSLIESFETNDVSEFYSKLDAWLAAKQANATLWNSNSVANSVDIHETLRAISETCLTVDDIKKKINSLFLDADFVRVPSVVCSTTHRAKGLEWDDVYILTWTYNSGKRKLTPAEAIEESNLMYINYTRTKNRLTNVSEV
jgi:superfamily I DNA/RNA helicase